MQDDRRASGKSRAVGIGLVGTGFMGGIHARSYRNAPMIFPDAAGQPDIRVVADLRLADARDFAERYGIPEWTDDWRMVLGRDDVELVDICTPPSLHQRIASEAAAAAKHIYCEKPVGRSLAETTAIWEAVCKAGVLSFVGFNYRWAPAVILAHELISSGRIGPVRQVKVSFRSSWDANGVAPWRWRFSREEAGGGALADTGSHVFDLALHLVGPITRVCGTTSITVPERVDPDPAAEGARRAVDNDDTFAALVVFANGATGIVDGSRVATGSRVELTFDIVGAAGAVRWDFRRMNELQAFFPNESPIEQGFATIQTGPAIWPYGQFAPSPQGLGYTETKVIEVYRVVDSVAKGEPIAPDIGDMVEVARLMDAVEHGGWIDISR